MRTTLDLDPNILRELKRRKDRDGRTLGQVASELLAAALRAEERPAPAFEWYSQPMGALVDLEDHDAVERAMADADA